MTEDQLELLEEARDSLSAAKLLLDGGYPGEHTLFVPYNLPEANG